MMRLLVAGSLVCLAALPLRAEWISLTQGATGVRLLDGGAGAQRLVCEVSGFEREAVEVEGATWWRIRVPEAAHLLEAGAPELPVLSASLAIADHGSTALQVVSEQHVDLPLQVLPSKGNLTRDVDPDDLPFVFGPAYQAAQWPAEQALAREPYILRGVRGQAVVFQPFQVLPTQGVLRIYTRLVVELASRPEPGINELDRPACLRDGEMFGDLYQKRFLNAQPLADRYSPAGEEGRMLIICHDAFLDAMAPFVDWKRQCGMEVDLVPKSVAGNSANAIRSYVSAYYQDPGLAFLLLVGDAEQVPSPSHSGGASDPTYAMVAGTDSYPDILVGRFSAATLPQLQTMVQRCVEYERDPQPGADWYQRGMGIASAEGAGQGDDNESDRQHMDRIRTDLLGYGHESVDQIYDPGASAATVTNNLNAGRSVVCYVGHGASTSWVTTGFSNSHVGNLQNAGRLPFIFDVACVNGQFNGTTCFAEAWMRASQGGQPTGAVGIYASTINQSWAPPMCAQDECVDLLVAESSLSFGALCYNGAMRMNDEYADYAMTRTWTVFTDPSLQVRTRRPEPLAIEAPAQLSSQPGEFRVRVDRPGARASLWADGRLLATARVGADSLALLDVLEPPAQGSALLTVTAHNALTGRLELPVAGAAAPQLSIQVDGSQVHLSWTEVPGASGYRIYHSDGRAGGWSLLGESRETRLSLSWRPGENAQFLVRAWSE